MNKKIKVIIILSIITGLLIFNITNKKENAIKETTEQINNTNILTMMLETEAETGNYEETTASEWPQEGYVFNESLSRCENGGTLSWDDDAKKVIMKSNSSDKCYVYFDIYVEPTIGQKICNNSGANSLACYIANSIYTEDGVNGLYYHDGVGTYTNASQEAGDNSYRYSGANPNNYVCFGSDSAACPNDNLYRIIGLFDDDKDGTYNVKLIKYDYTTSEMLGTDGRDYYGPNYYDVNTNYIGNMEETTIVGFRWNSDTSISSRGSNDWTTSELNKINLNTNYVNYLNNINSKWVDMIVTTTWHLGGLNDSGTKSYTAKEFYNAERSNNVYGSNPTTYRDEIGLMYPSDYGYAASSKYWTTNVDDYDNGAINDNWMYMGFWEWTITPDINYNEAFCIYNSGYSVSNFADIINSVRPVFYLNTNVNIADGTGTLSNPYRLSVN